MKNTPDNTATAPSLSRLAALLNMSRSALADYKARPGFPPRKATGYSVAAVRAFVGAIRATRGAKSDADKKDDAVLLELRKDKLRAQIKLGRTECALLDVKIAKAKAETMPRAEYHRDMAALLQVLSAGFTAAAEVVKTQCADAAAVTGAGASFASALATMRDHAGREGATP